MMPAMHWPDPGSDALAPDRVVLEVRAIAKSFGATPALKDMSLRLRGQILLDGQEVRLSGPGDTKRRGIAIICQELSLAGNLSVADNLFANHPPGRAD